MAMMRDEKIERRDAQRLEREKTLESRLSERKQGKQPVPFGRSGNFALGSTDTATTTRTNITVYTQGGREKSLSRVSEKIGEAMDTPIGQSSSNLETLE